MPTLDVPARDLPAHDQHSPPGARRTPDTPGAPGTQGAPGAPGAQDHPAAASARGRAWFRRPVLIGGVAVAVVVALAMAGIAVATGVGHVLGGGSSIRNGAGVVVHRGEVRVTDLRVGDCLEHWAASGAVGRVTVVPCTASHDSEVFAAVVADGGAAFPGDALINSQADTRCLAAAKTDLLPDDLATAKVAFFMPVASSWQAGQKDITCVARAAAPLTRSMRR